MTLSGTPLVTDIGANTVTIRAIDPYGYTDNSFVIVVSEVNDAPQFQTVQNVITNEDSAFSLEVFASDDVANDNSFHDNQPMK